MNTTIGTCSRCGGRVSVPTGWMGVTPPIPRCEYCGATQKNPHGPIIEMDKPESTSELDRKWLNPISRP